MKEKGRICFLMLVLALIIAMVPMTAINAEAASKKTTVNVFSSIKVKNGSESCMTKIS